MFESHISATVPLIITKFGTHGDAQEVNARYTESKRKLCMGKIKSVALSRLIFLARAAPTSAKARKA